MSESFEAFQVTQAYRRAPVAVHPLNAIVLLFDGAILSLRKTIEAGDARRMEESHAHLLRATAILRGLSHHLNFDKGGPLAERLYKSYNSLILASLRAFGRPDAAQRYRRLIVSLTELRNAWQHVATTRKS